MSLLKLIMKSVLSIFGSILFIVSIFFINSNGTTWGAGPALYGFFLIIPACFLLCLFRWNPFSKWVCITNGVGSIIYTSFRYFEAVQKQALWNERDQTHWPPSPTYQFFAIAVSVFLILYAVSAFSKNKDMATKLYVGNGA